MKNYTTEFVRNLSTGEPFVFDVKEETLKRLERQKEILKKGRLSFCSTEKELVLGFEFSLFSSFEDVLGIFSENGYTNDLITKILKDFGVNEKMIFRLLEDQRFVSKIKPWFEDIACDGGRATRTIKLVYCHVLTFYQDVGIPDIKPFVDFGSMLEHMITVFDVKKI